MNPEASRQTLTSASSTASTVDRARPRRANDTPVKQKPESNERVVPTPNSARHHKPWRGLTPSHNSKPDVSLPSRTPRKQPQHLARAFSAAAHLPSACKGQNPRRAHGPSSPPTSPPDSPRSAGGFSAFSDGDWDESLADNVKVVTRIRPPSQTELAAGGEGAEVCVSQVGARGVAVTTQRSAQPYEFAYDHVSSGDLGTQDDLFMLAGHPFVENCLAGYNSSIFAYGQTGAGKTYTMIGQLGKSDQRGLAPRVFEYIFKRIAEEEDNAGRDQLRFSVKCSFLEIYNETVTDLLCPSSGNLNLREDMKRGCYVDNLTEQIVLNVEDALSVMCKGTENRRIGETNMNRESSRSHSVFTCIMESSSKGAEDGCTRVKFSRLNLVDLAGSERNKLSGATGEHFKEACSINKSLTCLGRVIMELVEAQRMGKRHIHIPYRDSRLTFLLQDSLGGNAKTMIIANVSPCQMCAQETLSTLQFASRAKHIRNKAVINQDTNGDVAMLQREVVRLRRELGLVRDECTEPVVRENLELQERLIAFEKGKAELEDRLGASRSEVRKHKEQAEWAEKKYAELDRQRKAEEDSHQSSNKEAVDALWHRLEDASQAHKQEQQQLQQQMQELTTGHEQELQVLLQQQLQASDAHTQEVGRLQQQAEEVCSTHRQQLHDLQQKAEEAQSAHKQAVHDLQQQMENAVDAHKQEMERLQQQHERIVDVQRQKHQDALLRMQQQLEAQQAQHAAQISDMEGKANEMQSMWRQVSDLDQQHLAQLRAREADLDELNQQHASLQQELTCSQTLSSDTESQRQELQRQLDSREAELASTRARLTEEEASLTDTKCQLHMASQQLLEQQQAAAAKEADMTHATAQLQEQLLGAQADAEEAHAAAKLKQIEHESQSQQLTEELSHVKQCLAAEKQSVGELADAMRRHRRAAAKQDAEAAGREHKHQDEVQELKKAIALLQQDLEGKKEELHQEVIRSTKYKNVHLRIQDAISEVSDCMTPAGSSRYHRASHSVPSSKQHPWDLLPDSPKPQGLIPAGTLQPVTLEGSQHGEGLRVECESSNAENTAPGHFEESRAGSKGSWATSPTRMSRAETQRAEGRRASTGSSASTTRSNNLKSKQHARQLPHVQISDADTAGFNPLSPSNINR